MSGGGEGEGRLCGDDHCDASKLALGGLGPIYRMRAEIPVRSRPGISGLEFRATIGIAIVSAKKAVSGKTGTARPHIHRRYRKKRRDFARSQRQQPIFFSRIIGT
jgi:hypothetical protein